MSWHTNPIIVCVRNIARKAGLTRWLASVRIMDGYERAFDDAIFSVLREGDIIWDVGANVGYYTKRFAEAVGPTGHVLAFEPFPASAERLRRNMEKIPNYSLLLLALGAEEGCVMMQSGGDPFGTTNRIVEGADVGLRIRISTGDDIIARESLQFPTILKIDVEGFELDVLRGMKNMLAAPELRAVFVELHFGLLTERGYPNAPADIERLLRTSGFVTRWVDPSHIAAERG